VLAPLLAALPLLGAPSAAGTSDTLAALRSRGELLWGGDIQGGEPYAFEDPSDPTRLVGFEVEIAEALGRALGVRTRFVQSDWSNLVPGLERGDFDVALNGLEDTPARRDRLLLSVPYFAFGETLASPRLAAAPRCAPGADQTLADLLTPAARFEPISYEGVSERTPILPQPHRRGASGPRLPIATVAREGFSACPATSPETRRRHAPERRPQKSAIDNALSDMIRKGDPGRSSKIGDCGWPASSALPKNRPQALPPTEGGRSKAERRDTSGVRGWTFSDTDFRTRAAVTIFLDCRIRHRLPWSLARAGRLERRRVIRFASALRQVFTEPTSFAALRLYFALAPVVSGGGAAAILGLAMNYAAYEAEIHRGALLAVPKGQTEAARALGLTRLQALEHVLIPQSLRIALPSMTNDFVALLKDSSLVSVITVVELTKRMTIAAVDLRGWLVPGLLCAALYFSMSYPLARLAQRLERLRMIRSTCCNG
jgi:polar amino acid transport system substrate-binding protein